jgi:cytochrome c
MSAGRTARSAAAISVVLLAPLFARPAQAADAGAGAKTFGTFCNSCHSADAPPQNRQGPSLLGVVGRKAGTVADFRYSKAMKAYGKTWTPAALDAYLTAPQKVVPGAAMTFRGLSDSAARADLIAYLATRL